MEMLLSCFVCYVTFLTRSFISAEILKFHKHMKGLMGAEVRLECNYTGDDWIVVQWRRKTFDDLEFQTLLTIRDTSGEPIYAADLPSDLRLKIHSGINRLHGKTVFSLDMSPVECSDKGVYRCDITTLRGPFRGQTHLQLQAYPLKPDIYYEVLVSKPNTTHELYCEGNVGLPAGSLQWYYRPPNKDFFRLVDNPPQAHLKLDSHLCSYNAVTYYNVTVSASSNGTVYRCSINSLFTSSADPKFYDEVTVMLPKDPTKKLFTTNYSKKYISFTQIDTKQNKISSSHRNLQSFIFVTFITLLQMVT